MNGLRLLLSLTTALTSTSAIAQTLSQPAAAPIGEQTVQAVADGPAAAPVDSADIVVTAQKRSERLRDVPVSITAVSGEMLAKQNVTSTADLERIAPGFTYRLSQNGTPVFAIRGIGYYSESVAVAPAVTVYTDQVPLAYARMTAGAGLDLERVEVLKGPQGTLFGQNSTGGAVNYIAAKPTDVYTAGLDVTYGRFAQADVGGFVSGPITDRLTFRIAARSEQRGDWQRSITRDQSLGQRDFLVGRMLLDWEPVDAVQVEVNVNGWRDRSELQIGQPRGYLPISPGLPSIPLLVETRAALLAYPYVQGDSNRAADWDPGVDYRKDDRFYQASARVSVDLGADTRFVAISSYSDLRTFAPIDGDGTNIVSFTVKQSGRIKSFAQEARLEGDIGPVKWVIGGAYQKDKTSERQDNITIGSNSELLGVYYNGIALLNDQKVRDLGVFGGIDLKLTDTLTLQGSGRYTDENRDFSGCLADGGGEAGFRFAPIYPAGAVAPGACATFLPTGGFGRHQDSLNQHNVSWRGSINWKVTPEVMAYANAAKGFKAGTFATVPAVAFSQFTPVSQESVLSYEAGVKASLLDRKVELAAATFYYDYTDKQIQGFTFVPPFGNLPGLVSIPKSRIIGAEIDLTLKPVEGLRVTFGGTYVESKVTRDALVSSPFGDEINARGEAFPATPKWQLQSDAEYGFPLSATIAGYVGGNVNWRSGTVAAFGAATSLPGTEDYFRIPGYALVDLRAGVEIGGQYRLGIWGRNVTGKAYWNNVVHIYDVYDRITGMPATYGASFSARF